MHMFGVELDDLIKLKRTPAVRIVDDDFLLDPERLLPSPRVNGHLTRSSTRRGSCRPSVGERWRNHRTPPIARLAISCHYHGGILRFGKLTMSDADMQLIDADPKDQFDFFPKRYIKQLVAGYSKNTLSGGLKVYMPDYNQVDGVDLRPPRPNP